MSTLASRREFIRRSVFLAGTAGSFSIVPRSVLGGLRNVPPSDKLNIAGIGVGGQGSSNLRRLETENIVALCDVDPAYVAETVAAYPKAKFYVDYREMLDKQKDIDAVMIATPDHTHAVIAVAAMAEGKHVYCEKPLTHDVYEARMLAKASVEAKVATQMGNQGNSLEGHRLICEWIWAGIIGEVHAVDAWCSLSYYPWGHAYWSSQWSDRPKDTPPVPERLNWDLWIGPAPMRPYHRAYHPLTWRSWWDFGSGMMGDRGAHTLDSVFSALKLDPPLSIEATSCGGTPDVHPVSAIVTFRFAGRPGMPPVKLTWYEGTRPPHPEELEDDREMPAEGGAFFKGTKGTIMCGHYGQNPQIIPQARMDATELPEKTLPRVEGGHYQNWVRACKGGPPGGSCFTHSGPLTEICVLGNIAKRVDRRITWDPEGMEVTNYPQANQYVRTEYRKGWKL
jgi:predicted dehydrogenase